MSIELLQTRLKRYQVKSEQEEENALKEITQEILLLSLSRIDFFKHAAFQGGTALRIFYGLNRFSEDLDFALQKANKEFELMNFLNRLEDELAVYEYSMEIVDRSKANSAIRKAFIKTNSIGKVLTLNYPAEYEKGKKLLFKIELDVCPPEGAGFEVKYGDFPVPYSATLYDSKSLFAGKIHALLCRSYVKGRDWYDFLWYVSRQEAVNLTFLQNALYQMGPWTGQAMTITTDWIRSALSQRVSQIDWGLASRDVERFLKPYEIKSLSLWSESFFQAMINRM